MASRSATRVVDAVRTFEGEGFAVRRAFPTPDLDMVDPFLLLDEMGPADHRPGEAKGAPDHPHRGFETVTYLLEGAFEHRDSAGNAGRLGPGDVQWMTAGAGVVHSEMPARELQEQGGRLHGFQLWVNLPAADKMKPPHYQEIPAADIPVVTRDGVTARVIAGAALGTTGAVETHSPITYVHASLEPGATLTVPAPRSQHAFAHVFGGRGRAGGNATPVADGQLALFTADGDELTVAADDDSALEVLVLAGEPLREPVARYGPFVMNTRDEIVQAVRDYQDGRLGEISAA
jgi:redox-sensitive bicupin YhaK (pirin superfamily)